MGRPRTPSNKARLIGMQASRINDNEPVPADIPVQPPSWLMAHVKAAREADLVYVTLPNALDLWNQFAPDLYRQGVLTHQDAHAFAQWCQVQVEYQKAALIVAREGATTEGHRGAVKHPMATQMKDLLEVSLRLAARFGMTPADRAAIKVDRPDDGDSAARYVA